MMTSLGNLSSSSYLLTQHIQQFYLKNFSILLSPSFQK